MNLEEIKQLKHATDILTVITNMEKSQKSSY